MECYVCLERFNSTDRRPKSLPCGHCFCLRCLQQLPVKKCPLDTKVFMPSPDTLPDNLIVLGASNKSVETTSSRIWCRHCNKNALDDCVDGHPMYLCTLKKARVEDARPTLRSLDRGVEALEELGDTLDAAVQEQELALADSRGLLERERAHLIAARGRLQAALESDKETWARAIEAAKLGELSRTAAQLLPVLASPSATCCLTVQRAEGGGVVWRAAVKLAEDAVTRVLLCHLAAQGGLQLREELQRADAPKWQESSNGEDGEELHFPSLSVKEMAAGLMVGSKVARGLTEDGASAGCGTVTRKDSDGTVTVQWNHDGSSAVYSMGCDGRYDLRLVPQTHGIVLRRPSLKPELTGAHRGQGHFLDVRDHDLDDPTAEKTLGKILTHVRYLVSLPCKTYITGSQRALLQAAPHLEGLHMVAPLQRHLEVALKMPRLQTLCLTGVRGQQLLQVSQSVGESGSLRRLEVHCPFDAPLPVLTFPAAPAGQGLTWLRSGVYPLVTALALVRAHAASLEELQLVAASLKPYGCPDLAQELRRCGLKKLKRLALLRDTVFERSECRHSEDSCENQRQRLEDMFCKSNLNVTVVCDLCHYEQFSTAE